MKDSPHTHLVPELPEISFSLTFLQTMVERICDILVLQGVGGDSKLEDKKTGLSDQSNFFLLQWIFSMAKYQVKVRH